MSRQLLRIAPKKWRDRYEQEVLEMLRQSRHPFLDRFDLFRTAIALRWHERMKEMWVSRKVIVAFGLFLALTGVAAMWSAVLQLAQGWAELPMHWWSAPTILPVVAGLAVAAVGLLRRKNPNDVAPAMES